MQNGVSYFISVMSARPNQRTKPKFVLLIYIQGTYLHGVREAGTLYKRRTHRLPPLPPFRSTRERFISDDSSLPLSGGTTSDYKSSAHFRLPPGSVGLQRLVAHCARAIWLSAVAHVGCAYLPFLFLLSCAPFSNPAADSRTFFTSDENFFYPRTDCDCL